MPRGKAQNAKSTIELNISNKSDAQKSDTAIESIRADNNIVASVKETKKKDSGTKKTPRVYKANDLISCFSVTQGQLIYASSKSGNLYEWSNYGDITEVEYQDLLALRARKASYIYKPFFIITDEELLSDPKWKDVADLYKQFCTLDIEDLESIFQLDNSTFRHILSSMPDGLKEAVKIEATDRIENGTLDSIEKIKAIDEICEGDLSCLINWR